MEANLAELVTDLVATGAVGSSPQLRFREAARAPATIITSSDSQPGFTCDKYGHFLIVTDLEFTDSECIVCHTSMPAGVTACSKCGWTYKLHDD